MLTEKRHEIILQLLRKKGSITVNEIKDELGISEVFYYILCLNIS